MSLTSFVSRSVAIFAYYVYFVKFLNFFSFLSLFNFSLHHLHFHVSDFITVYGYIKGGLVQLFKNGDGMLEVY